VTLIGATTETIFRVIGALVSRSRVFQLPREDTDVA